MSTVAGKSPRGPAAQEPVPVRPISGPLELLDLEFQAKQLRLERGFQEHGQSGKTLVKHQDFRVVLMALRAGRRCSQHHAEESLSIQILEGDIRVHLAAEEVDLRAGYVLALAPNLEHDLEAMEDSTLLLTMAWTGKHKKPRPTAS